MYILHFRKLDLLQSGIQESFSISIQTMVTFFVLNIMVFYFEWRLALYLLGNWPLGIIGGLMVQQVRAYVIVYVHMCINYYIRTYTTYPNFLYNYVYIRILKL